MDVTVNLMHSKVNHGFSTGGIGDHKSPVVQYMRHGLVIKGALWSSGSNCRCWTNHRAFPVSKPSLLCMISLLVPNLRPIGFRHSQPPTGIRQPPQISYRRCLHLRHIPRNFLTQHNSHTTRMTKLWGISVQASRANE